MITLQDIFNAAWQAFIVEHKKPAFNDGGLCLYETDDGRRCAVGLVLTDDMLKRVHEWEKITNVIPTFAALRRDVLPGEFDPSLDSIFSRDIDDPQYVLHDQFYRGGWPTQNTLEERYRLYAKRMSLTIPGEQA